MEFDMKRYEELVRKEAEFELFKKALENAKYSWELESICEFFGIKIRKENESEEPTNA